MSRQIQLFNDGLSSWILYMTKNGTTKKPNKEEHPELYKWFTKNNSDKKKRDNGKPSDLTDERKEILDGVNFPWHLSNSQRWDKNYQALKHFKEKTGHCRVNRDTTTLGDWLNNQRRQLG